MIYRYEGYVFELIAMLVIFMWIVGEKLVRFGTVNLVERRKLKYGKLYVV